VRRWAIRARPDGKYLTKGWCSQRWEPLSERTRTWRTRTGARQVLEGLDGVDADIERVEDEEAIAYVH
jgi:hypothetical protein